MENIAVWGFSWVPPFAQGLVRDLRVRWALEEAGLAYESRWIDIEERSSDAYRRKHPFGMVPVLESGDGTLIESGAIVYAVAEHCEALMPPGQRIETLTWMFAALNTVEPPLWNLLVMDQLHPGEAWTKLRRAGVVDEVKARLAALSDWLDGRDYLLGRFTAADILMTTVLRFIRHTDLVAGFPLLDAYVKRCEARSAFQTALRCQMADYARNAPIAA
ncbi:glutathione S-transferase family protein [Rhodanobacter glycinis]|uniref:Glutathione S-transferase family protein n=1 Tax=Rhodanobacter glycinis TaxID=582702 RepID=A0A502CFB2_9GAMM|nr:glutathione S-transferase family protein [Rhodanobacter glycinis]TPG11678.1 glutathione S-transferase family protein [Rhodanobacter glycinis]